MIAACLSPEEVRNFASFAKSLGLSVLLEVHNEQELEDNIHANIDAIGINNRNLKDFSVDLNHSYNLVKKIPEGIIKISESGISDPQTIKALKAAGFQSFLIGENFMKTEDPVHAIQEFISKMG